MTTDTALARRDSGLPAVMPAEMSIEELVARTQKVQEAMRKVMRDGEHYGVIPGTGSHKPSLYKPGAEKLLNLFMMDPEYDAPPLYEGDHLTVVSRCTLYHIPTGMRLGSGMGMCSTREAKYAYRHQARVCPACGVEAIIKGKAEYGGGWLCFKKKDGCGAKFKDGDGAIESQPVGRVDNPDKADQYNTVLKMANKRSLVAAVLNVTGASDIFTQDLEDVAPEVPAELPEPPPRAKAQPAALDPNEDPRDFQSEDERKERAAMMGRIRAISDEKNISAKERRILWATHCNVASPETVSLDALGNLLDAVQKYGA